MSQVHTQGMDRSADQYFGLSRGGWYGELHRRQPVLAAFSFLMLAAMVPTLLALALEERTFNGVNVWIKPFKFELSTAIHMATLALFWPFLDGRFRARRGVRAAPWIVGMIFAVEVSYIIYRAALAEGSHFNNSTPVAALLYAAMGIGIVTTMVLTVWIGILILRSREGDHSPTLRLAIGLGLVLGSVLGAVSGAYMSAQPGHWVGGVATDAGSVPLFGWSRTGGDLRVAHFIGLHAIQGLPLVGWLVQRLPSGRILIWVAAAIWVGVTGAAFLQAIQGRALLPL